MTQEFEEIDGFRKNLTITGSSSVAGMTSPEGSWTKLGRYLKARFFGDQLVVAIDYDVPNYRNTAGRRIFDEMEISFATIDAIRKAQAPAEKPPENVASLLADLEAYGERATSAAGAAAALAEYKKYDRMWENGNRTNEDVFELRAHWRNEFRRLVAIAPDLVPAPTEPAAKSVVLPWMPRDGETRADAYWRIVNELRDPKGPPIYHRRTQAAEVDWDTYVNEVWTNEDLKRFYTTLQGVTSAPWTTTCKSPEELKAFRKQQQDEKQQAAKDRAEKAAEQKREEDRSSIAKQLQAAHDAVEQDSSGWVPMHCQPPAPPGPQGPLGWGADREENRDSIEKRLQAAIEASEWCPVSAKTACELMGLDPEKEKKAMREASAATEEVLESVSDFDRPWAGVQDYAYAADRAKESLAVRSSDFCLGGVYRLQNAVQMRQDTGPTRKEPPAPVSTRPVVLLGVVVIIAQLAAALSYWLTH